MRRRPVIVHSTVHSHGTEAQDSNSPWSGKLAPRPSSFARGKERYGTDNFLKRGDGRGGALGHGGKRAKEYWKKLREHVTGGGEDEAGQTGDGGDSPSKPVGDKKEEAKLQKLIKDEQANLKKMAELKRVNDEIERILVRYNDSADKSSGFSVDILELELGRLNRNAESTVQSLTEVCRSLKKADDYEDEDDEDDDDDDYYEGEDEGGASAATGEGRAQQDGSSAAEAPATAAGQDATAANREAAAAALPAEKAEKAEKKRERRRQERGKKKNRDRRVEDEQDDEDEDGEGGESTAAALASSEDALSQMQVLEGRVEQVNRLGKSICSSALRMLRDLMQDPNGPAERAKLADRVAGLTTSLEGAGMRAAELESRLDLLRGAAATQRGELDAAKQALGEAAEDRERVQQKYREAEAKATRIEAMRLRPCDSWIRPNPDVSSIAAARSPAAPRAAIPTSAHAPHCTLAHVPPCARRYAPSASRHAFAAE